MSDKSPVFYQDVEKCVDEIIQTVGKKIVLGLPLGLGKPNHFVNEIYKRAKEDPEVDLTICTALSLERPSWSNDLERRFLEPFVERLFGGYVDLEYMKDLRKRKVPPNIRIKEFYSKAGAYLNLRHAQENYISSNYTHAYRDILDAGANVIAQQVCKDEIDGRTQYSLSCNPDVTIDVSKVMREQQAKQGKKIAIVAQINQNLPFMYGDAVVDPGMFTAVIDDPKYNHRLFGAPKMAITTADFWIGLYASALIRDGGTLQIGIGSLGDALCYGLQLRHEHNDVYNQVLKESGILDKFGSIISDCGGTSRFEEGLLGSTEMLVDGYLHLVRSGIVKRKTFNSLPLQKLLNEGKITEEVTPATLEALLEIEAIQPRLNLDDFEFLQKFGILKDGLTWDNGFIIDDGIRIPADLSDQASLKLVVDKCLGNELKNGILIHGGFFLGPESFYEELRSMSVEDRKKIFMTSVLNVNQLYENEYGCEELRVLQRKHGRFVNACLMVTLSGNVVSDGLESGQMVSGVGGQYNFVSQAHALPDGRSILMCKGTRAKGKKVSSNIVFNYGHVTVPRHLRDIIITEYGIADLRGKTDQEIIAALLNITDSRFQEGLLEEAKKAGKIADGYQIPEEHRNNTPERLEQDLAAFRGKGFFPPFPFGTDFTDEELIIGKALKGLKARMSQGMKKISSLSKAVTIRKIPEKALPYLKRLQLDEVKGAKEKMMQKLVIHALSVIGKI
jgi:acyl-CoA hydrolase